MQTQYTNISIWVGKNNMVINILKFLRSFGPQIINNMTIWCVVFPYNSFLINITSTKVFFTII